jgi:hypothetical protein
LRSINIAKLQTFKFNFNSCFHLVVNILAQLNIFNQNFQNDIVDISTIEFTLDASISILAWHFLSKHGPNFGRFTKNFVSGCLSRAWVDGCSGLFHLTSLGYRLLIVCTYPISSQWLRPCYMCTTFKWNSLRSTKSLLPNNNVGETRKLIWYIVWHTKLISGLSDKITERLTEIPKKS